jgi:gamma-glutamylcyclotransferase (GGCT)/AIG2-like uncharacterized protein YtfP
MEKEYLFVYGQFRDSSKNLLDNPTYCGRATVDGKIYRVNDFYPGLISGADGKVLGDVYLVNSSNFEELDEFEGDEYIRTKLRTSTDVYCWVYVYKYDISEFTEIKGGDWLLR